ncbi:MAG: hypothetical protein ACI9UA_006066 [Pseudoalteromonas tetraodonis]|jgi:hypothetical protein
MLHHSGFVGGKQLPSYAKMLKLEALTETDRSK